MFGNSFVIDSNLIASVLDDNQNGEMIAYEEDQNQTGYFETVSIDHYNPNSYGEEPAVSAPVTGNWLEAYTAEGHLYYYNDQTGESSWTLPDVARPQQTYDYSVQPYNADNSVNSYDPNSYNTYGQYQNSDQYQDPYSYEQTNVNSHAPIAITSEVLLIFYILTQLLTKIFKKVVKFSKQEALARQITLLSVQDQWQNAFVQTQFFITEQKSIFEKSREEMFDKVSKRVNTRLTTFVDDIKYLQKSLKKGNRSTNTQYLSNSNFNTSELADLNVSERDLRRLFHEENKNSILAEKLSYILEGLEKLKNATDNKFKASMKQLDKFAADWKLIETG